MKQYHDLLRSILKNGTEHRDRTGVGTISHFGYQTRFDLREGVRSVWAAKWELAMPAVVLVAMFSGLATAVEASALIALYALVVQTVVHRDF